MTRWVHDSYHVKILCKSDTIWTGDVVLYGRLNQLNDDVVNGGGIL